MPSRAPATEMNVEMIETAAPGLTAAKNEAARAIRAAVRIVISSHVNPDGDAIGSILGTALALAAAGKQALPINPDTVPWTFQKLPQAGLVRQWPALREFGRPDLWLALDTADEPRLGLPADVRPLLDGVPIIQFDHHITNTRYGGINLVEPGAAACCEQMALFLLDESFPITAEAATAMLTGLSTDSGGFRFTSVTANTFRAAAGLVDRGAKPGDVGKLLGVRRFAATRLWGLVLNTLDQFANGRIVTVYVTRAMFDQVGLTEEGTEGLVESIKGIEGVDTAILFREEASGEVKVSFRTSEAVDATVLAVANGGGGHPRAAGCTVAGPLDAARRRVIEQTAQLLTTGTLPA